MWRRIDFALTDVSEARQLTHYLHGATSQKKAFFIVAAVKTSNLTKYRKCHTQRKADAKFVEKCFTHSRILLANVMRKKNA
jgi:hypothetical protein